MEMFARQNNTLNNTMQRIDFQETLHIGKQKVPLPIKRCHVYFAPE